jgi:hypothetical protein
MTLMSAEQSQSKNLDRARTLECQNAMTTGADLTVLRKHISVAACMVA